MRLTLPIVFILGVVPCLAQHQSYGGAVSSIPYRSNIGTGRNAPFPRGAGRRGSYAGYPAYIGLYGYGYGSSYYGDDSGSNTLAPLSADSSAAPAPPVIINRYFGTPPPTADQAQPAPDQPESAPPPEARTYLIAYKDHSVYTALAYWIEDHTLHYVTTSNTHNQADLSLIDVDFTKKLNSDRNMPFNAPTTPAH
jgi:hypothetical protein